MGDLDDKNKAPYHCWSPTSVSAYHKKEVRRMVEAKVKAGLREEVLWAMDLCSRSFFIKNAGAPGKLRMVTNFRRVNEYLPRPGWPFPSADKIRRTLRPEDRGFVKVDSTKGDQQVPIWEEDRDLTATLLSWGSIVADACLWVSARVLIIFVTEQMLPWGGRGCP